MDAFTWLVLCHFGLSTVLAKSNAFVVTFHPFVRIGSLVRQPDEPQAGSQNQLSTSFHLQKRGNRVSVPWPYAPRIQYVHPPPRLLDRLHFAFFVLHHFYF